MFALAISIKDFKFVTPMALFFSPLLTLGFPKYSSSERGCASSFSCGWLLFWSHVDVIVKGNRGEVFHNIIIKSQSFSRLISLGCDLHKCFSSGIASSLSLSFPPSLSSSFFVFLMSLLSSLSLPSSLYTLYTSFPFFSLFFLFTLCLIVGCSFALFLFVYHSFPQTITVKMRSLDNI